jgi:hypothetical protein
MPIKGTPRFLGNPFEYNKLHDIILMNTTMVDFLFFSDFTLKGDEEEEWFE